jgi:hypothetical protein
LEHNDQGVQFFEGRVAKAREIGPIRFELGGAFNSSQLQSLDEVKRLVAKKVLAAGGNAVMNFRYGQRSVGFLRSLFHRDDVIWYAEGTIIQLTRDCLASPWLDV